MKFFKLFILSFAALPSMALGMIEGSEDTVFFRGKTYDLSKVKSEKLKEDIKSLVSKEEWPQAYCDYVLDPERIGSIEKIITRRPIGSYYGCAALSYSKRDGGFFEHAYLGDQEVRVCDYFDKPTLLLLCEDLAKGWIKYPALSDVILGFYRDRKFKYPDGRIFFRVIPGAESGKIPVSLHISDRQCDWLFSKSLDKSFVATRYSACISSIKLTDKNNNSVILERCRLSDPHSCCVIKRDGEVLVPCEKHAHEHIKRAPSGWWSTIKGYAGSCMHWQKRSVINAALIGAGLYAASKVSRSWIDGITSKWA